MVPYEEIVIDFIGTLTRKRFVLMIVDSATKTLEAIPMRTITAKNVAENLFFKNLLQKTSSNIHHASRNSKNYQIG